MPQDYSDTGHATGAVRASLQIEGAAIAVIACVAFAYTGASCWLFAALILGPDLAMIGYLRSPRIGAIAYNLAHTYTAPAGLAAVAIAFDWGAAWPVVCVWVVHIAADRMLGYGLKYARGFKATHLSTGKEV